MRTVDNESEDGCRIVGAVDVVFDSNVGSTFWLSHRIACAEEVAYKVEVRVVTVRAVVVVVTVEMDVNVIGSGSSIGN